MEKKSSFLVVCTFALLSSFFFSCNETKKTANSPKYFVNMAKTADGHALNPLLELGKQYYSDYDIDLKITGIEYNSIFQTLAAGKVDASYVTLTTPIRYGAQNEDVLIYAGAMTGGVGVFVNKDADFGGKDLHDPQSWKGHSVGFITESTVGLALRGILKNAGLKEGTDWTYREITEYPALISAGAKGVFDILLCPPDYVSTAKQLGLVFKFPMVELSPDYVCCRQSANCTYFNKNKEAFISLLKAEIRAYKDFKLNAQQESIEKMAKTSGVDEETIYNYLYNKENLLGRSHNPDPNYNGVYGVYSVLDYERPLYEFFDISAYATALQSIIAEFPEESFYKDMWAFFIENNSLYPDFSKTYHAL